MVVSAASSEGPRSLPLTAASSVTGWGAAHGALLLARDERQMRRPALSRAVTNQILRPSREIDGPSSAKAEFSSETLVRAPQGSAEDIRRDVQRSLLPLRSDRKNISSRSPVKVGSAS